MFFIQSEQLHFNFSRFAVLGIPTHFGWNQPPQLSQAIIEYKNFFLSQIKISYQSLLLHYTVFGKYNIKYYLELKMMISFYNFSLFQIDDNGDVPSSLSIIKIFITTVFIEKLL